MTESWYVVCRKRVRDIQRRVKAKKARTTMPTPVEEAPEYQGNDEEWVD
jgi:hypothetical protein